MPRKARVSEKILWETAPDKLFAETIIRNFETKEGKTLPFTFVMAPLRKTTRHLLNTDQTPENPCTYLPSFDGSY